MNYRSPLGAWVVHNDSFSNNLELYEHIPLDRERHKLQSKNTGIRPDGGVLMIVINGKRFPLIASEHKKQGDGKNQSKGNAIERSSKNIMFMQTWMASEGILPYLFICCGKDFSQGSYIIDRVATMMHNYPLNKINLYKDKYGIGGPSLFYRAEGGHEAFSEKEMYDLCHEIAEKSLLYYQKKYGNVVNTRVLEENEQR